MNTHQRAMQWIVGRDTGTSSKTIWAVMQMVEPDHADTPADPDDFGRCYRLLQLIPEWRKNLSLVAFAYPTWAPLVREWDALTEMFEEGRRTNWAPPYVMYERMQELNEEGRLLAGWTQGGAVSPPAGHRVPREVIERALKPQRSESVREKRS